MQSTTPRILITRPAEQADKLIEKLKAIDTDPISCPTIKIVSIENSDALDLIFEQLASYNIAIFVSPNAVWPIQHKLKLKLHKQLIIAAIGSGTANALKNANIPIHLQPTINFTSEGLLELPALQQIKNKKIVIFCGKDGREFLYDELRKRGAEVTKAMVYERQVPQILPERKQFLDTLAFDIILCTSAEGLKNLIAMIDKARQSKLFNIPLIVGSRRLSTQAQELGFTNIFIAENASDEAIIDIIGEMQKKNLKERFMTSENNHETVTPQETLVESEPIIASEEKNQPCHSNFLCIIASFALVLSLLAVAGAAINWLNFKRQHRSNNQNIHLLQTAAKQNQNRIEFLTGQIKTTQDVVQKQQNISQQNQQSLNQALAIASSNPRNRILIEVSQLYSLAHLSLHYGHDILGATALLQNANNLLLTLKQPDLLPLQQMVANNILGLKSIPPINILNILTRITAINNHLQQLPLHRIQLKSSTISSSNQTTSSQQPWYIHWRDMFENSLRAMGKMIIIRHQNQSIQPLLSPPQQYLLIKNIQLLLNQAQWATLHNDNQVYQFSLKQAVLQISGNFATNDPKTLAILDEIHSLQQINVNPALPDLDDTQQLINQLLTAPVKPNTNNSAPPLNEVSP